MRTLITICLLLTSATACADDANVSIRPDVVYGHKDGLAMTFDVFTPKKDANGVGILFMVSGGWYSHWAPPEQIHFFFKPLTERGFTVFAVRHGSSPRYGIPDAVSDVRRSVRYIRKNAERFNVDPNRLGVFGMSAGGHLSLMLGTTADEGNPDDKDAVGRISDRVQAVVAFVAPTDLTIMVKDYPQRLPAYANFPALNLDMKNAEDHSPLKHVTPDDAPTLLIVGAKDDLVPVEHSRKIQAEFDDKKVPNKLTEFENAGHGFAKEDMISAQAEMANWFEKHLVEQ